MDEQSVNLPEPLMAVWRQFDRVPVETLTKAWWSRQPGGFRQRTVDEMLAHRAACGTGGNCFDLSIWLMHVLHQAGIEAHAIGRDWFTPAAHVAVAATVGRVQYLCDLGDQWISPIPIPAPGHQSDMVQNAFPGAQVRLVTDAGGCEVTYHRPTGKVSRQRYDLALPEDQLLRAAHYSQRLLRQPLCEMRIPEAGEIRHWEFSDGRSFWSTNSGLQEEPPCSSPTEWCERIHARTGIGRSIIAAALEIYSEAP